MTTNVGGGPQEDTGAPRWLGAEDKEALDLAMARLERCVVTEREKAIVDEIELRYMAILFLRGRDREKGEALEVLERRHAVVFLVDGLKHESRTARVDAVKVLGRIGDKQALPALVEALTAAANTPIEGSTGDWMPLLRLREELVLTIGKLTGEHFSVSAYDDPTQIRPVIEAAQRWVEEHMQPDPGSPEADRD
jgi:HEAT repeat protein